MTAFARVEKTTSHASIQWEIKSVNHRFLETQIRLPEALRDMESDLKGLVRCSLSRGKVDCVLKLNTAETNHGEINQTELDLLLGSISGNGVVSERFAGGQEKELTARVLGNRVTGASAATCCTANR